MRNLLLILAAVFSSSLYCNSQNLTQYLGEGKIYQTLSWEDVLCYATFNSVYSSVYGDHVKSNLIYLYVNSNFVGYTSSHGDYVEILHSQNISGSTSSYTISKNMVFYAYPYGLCAFTINGKQLCLVSVRSDAIISVFDNNFSEGSDFSIFVKDRSVISASRRYEPSFYIVNNGYVKVYNDISSNKNNIDAVVDVRNNAIKEKKYTLKGIETESPHEEIFIQNGKKMIAK
ncbi:MAG: hypothetical protein K5672_06530 [Bacteroidaceae bacterium]|nr:hypothetical protein [Bacteroidaceae bacterium]